MLPASSFFCFAATANNESFQGISKIKKPEIHVDKLFGDLGSFEVFLIAISSVLHCIIFRSFSHSLSLSFLVEKFMNEAKTMLLNLSNLLLQAKTRKQTFATAKADAKALKTKLNCNEIFSFSIQSSSC